MHLHLKPALTKMFRRRSWSSRVHFEMSVCFCGILFDSCDVPESCVGQFSDWLSLEAPLHIPTVMSDHKALLLLWLNRTHKCSQPLQHFSTLAISCATGSQLSTVLCFITAEELVKRRIKILKGFV